MTAWSNFRFLQLNSVFFKFLISFIAVSLIPILSLGLLCYFVFERSIQKEVNKYNEVLLQSSAEGVEQKLYEIKRMTYQNSLSIKLEGDNYLKINEVASLLSRIKNTNQYIDEIYVYYSQLDKVVNSDGLYDADYYFSRNKFLDIPNEQWVSVLKGRNDFQVFGTERVEVNGQLQHKVMILTSFPLYNDTLNGTLVVWVDEEALRSLIQLSNVNYGMSRMFIVDQSNKLITMSHQDESEWNKISSILPRPDKLLNEQGIGEQFIQDKGEQWSILAISSKVTKWTYVVATPTEAITSRAKYVRNITFVVCFILLGIGLALSYIISQNLYRPIGQLINHFGTLKDKVPDAMKKQKMNEFSIINHYFQNFMQQNSELLSKISSSSVLIRDYCVQSLLLGKNDSQSRLFTQEILDSFQFPNFTVVVVDCEESSSLFSGKLEPTMMKLLELNGDRMSGVLTKITEKRYSILVNFSDENELKGMLGSLGTAVATTSINPMGQIVIIGVGNLHKHISYINRAFEEAVLSLDYRYIGSHCQVIYYREAVIDEHADALIYFPIDIEQQLIACTITGDMDGVNQAIDQIMNRNAPSMMTVKLAKAIYRELFGTVQKIAVQGKLVLKDLSISEALEQPILHQFKTIQEFKAYLQDMFIPLSEVFISKKESGNLKLKKEMIQFIEDHLSEELSLDRISSSFQINPKYASRFFKDQTGSNFVDYVNQLRVNKAKELMSEHPELKIGEIAEQVGFLSLNTFINTFKKCEKMTPGQFKQLLSDNKSI